MPGRLYEDQQAYRLTHGLDPSTDPAHASAALAKKSPPADRAEDKAAARTHRSWHKGMVAASASGGVAFEVASQLASDAPLASRISWAVTGGVLLVPAAWDSIRAWWRGEK